MLDRTGKPKHGDPISFQLDDPPLTEEEFAALKRVMDRRAFKHERGVNKTYPVSGATSGCGERLAGSYRIDRDLRQYICISRRWSAQDTYKCSCPRIDANWLDSQAIRPGRACGVGTVARNHPAISDALASNAGTGAQTLWSAAGGGSTRNVTRPAGSRGLGADSPGLTFAGCE
jgi:hypothetical protein